MAVIQITPFDFLTQRLWIVLEQVAKIDICDPDEHFPELRLDAHAELRTILTEAARRGYTEAELYDYVIGGEEGRADFEAED